MKTHSIKYVLILLLITISHQVTAQEKLNDSLTFVVATDMRFYTVDEYHSTQHFLGAIEAIKKVGEGSFMLSPGDFDPPQAVRDMLTQAFGADYPWYPAIGNHEAETTSYVEWLRQYNKYGISLQNIIRKGPPGCEETTFSFEWANCHFVILNQYYDGKSDHATDGNVVPELLNWLEEDLSSNTKKHIFVCGHEPIVVIPDMDNGKFTHLGDSLDQYPENSFRFHQLLLKYGVTAYICGHTHSASYSKINGVWQIDIAHARGIEEGLTPEGLFKYMSKSMQKNLMQDLSENELIKEFYESDKKAIKKTIFHMGFADVDSYKKIDDDLAIQAVTQFYFDYKTGGESKEKHIKTFWKKSNFRKSTFLKVYAGKENVKVEFYRDDARGGPYSLRHTIILD